MFCNFNFSNLENDLHLRTERAHECIFRGSRGTSFPAQHEPWWLASLWFQSMNQSAQKTLYISLTMFRFGGFVWHPKGPHKLNTNWIHSPSFLIQFVVMLWNIYWFIQHIINQALHCLLWGFPIWPVLVFFNKK